MDILATPKQLQIPYRQPHQGNNFEINDYILYLSALSLYFHHHFPFPPPALLAFDQ
jgi:hypothetical protein